MIDELHARHLVGVADVRQVWLIRHADAYGGLESLAAGTVDPPLSEGGRQQAARLAARLASVPLHAVWSSDLRRVRTYWDEGREQKRAAPGSYPFPEPEEEVVARMRAVLADVVAGLAEVDAPAPRAAVVTHNGTIAIYLS